MAARVLAEAGRRVEATILVAGTKAAERLKTAAEQASRLEQQARQLLVEAELERARIQAAATRTAEQVRAGADREARALLAKVREDAELAWQDAVRQRRLLAAEAEALATHRQRMAEQLGRLYAPLGLLVVGADESHRDGNSGSGLQSED
jgi:pimeloyl-ACP methyl ester carboxylesterase